MSRSVARVVTALLLLPAGPAAAETLYNQDGVQLSATARLIDPAAATCRVREERHTAEQYERLKPNDAQPLKVWRVELVVANYSGKALDYLNAHLNVTSDWPPCDHWDGLEAHYGAPVVWTGPLMSIQDVGTVEPGEEVRETAFVLAWHEEEPALGRWDINYEFAAGSSAARAGDAPPAERREAPAASETQREPTPRGLETEPDQTCGVLGLFSGEIMTINWTGDCTDGLANGTGKEIDDWAERVSGGTHVYEGTYVDGKRQGHWTEDRKGYVSEGTYVDGKKHGHWTERGEFEFDREGLYVDGKRQGHWTFADPSGVDEGPYVDGKRHGRWTKRHADGDVTYDCYYNDDEVDCP